MLTIGTYNPAQIMKSVHTSPEEAVQAFVDLHGKALLGIHWGTFDLAKEPLEEPPQRLRKEAERRKLDPRRIWVLKHGETRHW